MVAAGVGSPIKAFGLSSQRPTRKDSNESHITAQKPVSLVIDSAKNAGALA